MGKIIKNGIEYAGCNTDIYTKAETNALLNDKADKSTTYTKTETNNLVNNKVSFNTSSLNSVEFNKDANKTFHQILATHSDNTQWAINFDEQHIKTFERQNASTGFTEKSTYKPEEDSGLKYLNTTDANVLIPVAYRKKNGVVYANMAANVNNCTKTTWTAGEDAVVAILPAGFRPYFSYALGVALLDGGAEKGLELYINQSGEVHLRCGATATTMTKFINAQVSFFT